ncbi:BppU family phage baseplate upper protein, partial [Clostridium perfringens]
INNPKEKEGVYVSNGIDIQISKSKLSNPTIEGFKAWLKANPTTIVYQLATPVTEIVENCVDIDLDTYQEKTYFNILNSLPGTLDFKVPSNIGSLVQSNAKEINNINEFINNFILKALLEMNKDLATIKIKNGLN